MKTKKNSIKSNLRQRLPSYRTMALSAAAGMILIPEAGAELQQYDLSSPATADPGGRIFIDIDGIDVDGQGYRTGTVLDNGTAHEEFFLWNRSVFLYGNTYKDAMIRPINNGSAAIFGPVLGQTVNQPAYIATEGFSVRPEDATPIGTGTFAGALHTQYSYGNWSPGDTGWLGLRFDMGGSGNQHAGWAYVTLNPDATITLGAFAYEDVSGDPAITAVPESSHAALLMAAGAAGIAAYRRRRKKS